MPVPAVVLIAAPEKAIWRIDGPNAQIFLPTPLSGYVSDHVGEDLASGSLVLRGPESDRKVELSALHTFRRLASGKGTAFEQFPCDASPDASL